MPFADDFAGFGAAMTRADAAPGRDRPASPIVAAPAKNERAAPSRSGFDARACLWLVGRMFPPGTQVEAVTTSATFEARPDEVWERLMFYEEVPHRPPLLLRLFLPSPVSTQGSGKHVGASVECVYSRGSLVKRITVLDRPHLVRFEVLEQHLGIERCVTTVEGSYEIRGSGDGSSVALTTRYRGHLRPRRLWRPIERTLAHALHRHILAGMGATCMQRNEEASAAAS